MTHKEWLLLLPTLLAGGSTKYFSTYHAELTKPKKDPTCESNCVYG